jgi:hypothetical protein
MATMRTTTALTLALLAAAPAAAQQRAQPDSAHCAAAPADTAAHPVLRIQAHVTARTLRVDSRDSASIAVAPCAPGSGVRVERENLPERLQPGVTYQNVGVRLTIAADAALTCRLAAALAAPSDTAAARVAKTCDAAAPPSPPTTGAPPR